MSASSHLANADGDNPLFRAVSTGDTDTLQRLLQNPDINAYETDISGRTALMIAADKGYADCIQRFLDADKTANINAQDNSGATAVMPVLSRGNFLERIRYSVNTRTTDVNQCRADRKTALTIAAENGYFEIVKILTGVEGIDVNISNTLSKRTALMLALQGGHKECVKCLIDTGLADVNLCDKDGNTALMIAAEKGYLEIVNILTGVNGIAVNISNTLSKNTASMLALEGGHKECVKCLINSGLTDVNVCDEDGCTLLMLAAERGYYEILKILTRVEGIAVNIRKTSCKKTALMFASEGGHKECVKCLIDTGLADANLCDIHGMTAIMIAAKKGYCEIVEILARVEGIAINIGQHWTNKTALIFASLGGYKECIKCLIDTGPADVNLCDEDGYTALMIASEKGCLEIVKTLALVEGIDINISDKRFGRTALMLTLWGSHKECVKCLIDTGLTDVNICDKDGNTALMIAARKNYYEIVEILIGVEGLAVNISDKRNGRSALMLASERGHKECVKCLIDTGLTDVNLCDEDGNTALMIAAEKGYYEIVEMLTGVEGIDVDISDKQYGRTALMLALRGGHKECTLLSSKAEVNIQDNNGQTALICASSKGYIRFVEALINSKAEVNIQDNKGQTALIYASSKGYIQCVEALISSKAEVNIQDNKGQTALICASSKGHTQCVDALINSKAEVNIQDNKGQTALMLAVLSQELECVKCIIDETRANVWESDHIGKTGFTLAAEIPDVRFLRCFFDITVTKFADDDQGDEIFTTVFGLQNPEVFIRYLPGFTWRKPYIYERDHNEESVVNLIIRNGLGRCLTCFLLAYSDVPLTENCPCSHSLLDNTEACEYDEDVQTALMIASKRGNSECLEYLLQFQRIRFHLLVMLLQKEFLVFGTISIIFYKRLCSLVRDHNNIDQFLYLVCNGEEIGKCVDYLLSAVICQTNSSGNSAISFAFEGYTKSEQKLLLQHVSGKKHFLVCMKKFYLKNPMRKLSLNTVLVLVKAGFFLWKWYPEFHGHEDRINILTRELVTRDFAPGLFEWQGKQSSPLYYAFMSGNHGLVRYLMANLYLTPNDLECFQGDTQERESLLQIESEEIQQIYQEHFEAPWSLERLSILSLSNWLRKNKEQKDVDKVLDKLPEMFRSPSQWEKINLDFLNHRMSEPLNDEGAE